jgi:type 1 glutamine amidotransferase
VNVLLRLAESSYQVGEGAMGSDHPIAWYHEFDGGRAWYTGLGHRIELYTDPVFTQHLLGGIRWAAGVAP